MVKSKTLIISFFCVLVIKASSTDPPLLQEISKGMYGFVILIHMMAYANKMTFATIKASLSYFSFKTFTQDIFYCGFNLIALWVLSTGSGHTAEYNINRRRALSCFNGGSMANLCKQLPHI